MAVYSYVVLSSSMYRCVGLCMVMYSDVLLCRAMCA